MTQAVSSCASEKDGEYSNVRSRFLGGNHSATANYQCPSSSIARPLLAEANPQQDCECGGQGDKQRDLQDNLTADGSHGDHPESRPARRATHSWQAIWSRWPAPSNGVGRSFRRTGIIINCSSIMARLHPFASSIRDVTPDRRNRRCPAFSMIRKLPIRRFL